MKRFTLSLSLTIFFFTFHSHAQTFASYSELSFVFKADSTTRSALISNLMENRSGYQAPVMGAASWTEDGRSMECRSLIAFDYGTMPTLVKPENIISAYLFLNPVQLENETDDDDASSAKFMVSRIAQPWIDSSINWLNQPAVNTKDQVIKTVPAKKKDHTVKIEVTEIVRNMFSSGNNGFLISYKEKAPANTSLSQWFASAKNENENIRPILVINYQVPYSRGSGNDGVPPLPLTAQDKKEIIQNYFRPEPVVKTETQEKTPVKEQKEN